MTSFGKSVAASVRASIVALAVVLAAPAAAAQDTLFTLQSASNANLKLKIVDQPGAQRVRPVAVSDRWKLRPGDPLQADKHPRDRAVALYGGTALAPTLLCRVILRYYRTDDGWVPAFRLEEEPAVARVNGRWVPIGGVAGLVQYGNTLANAEGFFPVLEFGAGAGSTALVAWQVR